MSFMDDMSAQRHPKNHIQLNGIHKKQMADKLPAICFYIPLNII